MPCFILLLLAAAALLLANAEFSNSNPPPVEDMQLGREEEQTPPAGENMQLGREEQTPSGENARARALVAAWAQTGTCNAERFAGRCGVVAAVVHGRSPPSFVQLAAGGIRAQSQARLATSSLFEIASNTKVLTAIAFHRLVHEGRARLNETLVSFLPSSVVFKNATVGQIQMIELLSHTSGLPRLPSNLHGTPQNQFTNYSQQDLFDFITNLSSLPTRGTFLYSNLGFGLLGHLLELRTGLSYERLLHASVLAPLNMSDSKIALTTKEWAQNVAPGLDKQGVLAERNTPYGVLKGQGAYHSSARDMGQFLSAHLKLLSSVETPSDLPKSLVAAMRSAIVPIALDEYRSEHGEVASAWQIYRAAGAPVMWKSGGTAGYGSFMAFNLHTGRAAVALGSCGNCGGKAIQQLTRQLVDSAHGRISQLPHPVSAADLAGMLGCFELQGGTMSHGAKMASETATILRVWRVSRSNELRITIVGSDGSGTASLTPIPWELSANRTTPCSTKTPCMLPIALALRGNDTVVVRPPAVSSARVARAHSPLHVADRRHGRREVYFSNTNNAVHSKNPMQATMLGIHVNGWDLFASRVSCGQVAWSGNGTDKR